MMMPPQQGGMPPEMMQQAPMMPQQAPPDPAQMHAAVVARLEEIEIEKAELIGILQQMEGGAPQQMAAAPPMGPPMEPGLLG
tara:strand:- start:518 stop:763 length:246 start_codon:yes stop_codon:yes gene_type:complete